MAAKKAATKTELPKDGQVVRIKAQRDGYRRAGIAHTQTAADHPFDAFTVEQLEQLQNDPNLIVAIVDKPDAG